MVEIECRKPGLMLFAGLVLGSAGLVKAAGSYFSDPFSEAKRYFSIFEHEVGQELEQRRHDPESIETLLELDRRIESTLFFDHDPEYERNRQIEDFILDVYSDAFKRTARQFEWYVDLKQGFRDRFSGDDHPEDPSYSEKEPSPQDADSVFSFEEKKIGFHGSLSGGSPEASVSLELERLRFFDAYFQKGEIEVGNNIFSACLRRAVSDYIFEIGYSIEDFESPEEEVKLGMSFRVDDHSRINLSAGYMDRHDDERMEYVLLGYCALR